MRHSLLVAVCLALSLTLDYLVLPGRPGSYISVALVAVAVGLLLRRHAWIVGGVLGLGHGSVVLVVSYLVLQSFVSEGIRQSASSFGYAHAATYVLPLAFMGAVVAGSVAAIRHCGRRN